MAMKVFYSDDYVAAAHSFDTTRKSKWIADSLASAPIPGVELAAPPPVTREQLLEVHDEAYVDAVAIGSPAGLASSQGFSWDPGLWRAVCASNGGAMAAALSAMEDGVAGSLSSGLHHARRGRGAGFCTFNGLVLAADAALNAGAGRVLILDLDAHCGGGTSELVARRDRVIHRDVAVSSFDEYVADGVHQELTLVDRADYYLKAVDATLQSVPGDIDLVIYNAGMDPYQGCDIGGLVGISAQVLETRERLVFDWTRISGIPIAFVLAGGYTGRRLQAQRLVELHRLTISAAADLQAVSADQC